MYLIHSPILSNNQISSTNGDDTFNAAHTILKGHYFCNQKNIDYWVQKCTKMLSSCDVTQSFMYIQYRLYNVLVWSEKMDTIQFFPIRSKIKHLQYYLFMYFENNIRSFCILFFSGQNYYGAGSPNFANWWCSDVFVAKRNGRVLFGYSALELLAPAQHRSPNFYLCDVMPSSWVNVWKIYREFNIRPRSCWNLKSYKSLSQNVKDVFIQSIFKILD